MTNKRSQSAQEQLGVTAEANLHGLFLMFNCIDGNEAKIRKVLGELPSYFEQIADQYFESMLTGMIAIGALYWDVLYPDSRPAELKSFMANKENYDQLADTPFDLFIQVRSDRADVNHIVGRFVCNQLQGVADLAEEINGFRYCDGRDLTGFVLGFSTPKGSMRRQVAVVNDGSPYAGGSYVHVQRFVHNLRAWDALTCAEQEDVMGCNKAKNQPHNFALQAVNSHFSRSTLMTEAGDSVETVRHDMPYGDMRNQGVYAIHCCKNAQFFDAIIENQFSVTQPEHSDRLLEYTQAETGAAFFAPSLSFLRRGH